MRQAVIVAFEHHPPQEIDLHAHAAPMPAEAARQWLDAQFLAHDCEPPRPTGKLLIADKVLALAAAAGPVRLARDADWAHAFAAAVLGALGRSIVRVDLAAGTVSH